MLRQIRDNIQNLSSKNAFYIQDHFYTYGDFACSISGIRKQLSAIPRTGKQEVIGIINADNIETYAAIIALWLEGLVYLPINPNNPGSRNLSIVDQAECKTILFSDNSINFSKENDFNFINIKGIKSENINLDFKKTEDNNLLYIIFTSGSTGVPKGVPISYKNLASFITDFAGAGYNLTPEDRFLQIYDLSFDASVHCYTLPLFIGGCIYTVPQNDVKYMYAYKLLDKQQITFAKMPPSTVSYLRPFFDRIRLPHLKYCLFGGEAFYTSLVNDWQQCIPNAEIHNVYGPTEVTINCTIYPYYETISDEDIYQGISTIGRTFGSNKAVIIDKKNMVLPKNKKGELCFSGNQVTQGYINNPDKNKEAFATILIDGVTERFYKTGDLAFINNNNNIIFCGRIDNQVQVDGYRIELGEIENKAMEITNGNVAALPQYVDGKTTIILFTENYGNKDDLMAYLQDNLPRYMVPRKIINQSFFPKSAGGKINKKALLDQIENKND